MFKDKEGSVMAAWGPLSGGQGLGSLLLHLGDWLIGMASSLANGGLQLSFWNILSLNSFNSRLPLRFNSSIWWIDCLNLFPIRNFATLETESSISESALDSLIDGDSQDNMESGVLEGGCTASRRLDRWPGAALLESALSQGFRGRSLDSNDPFEVIDPSSDRIEFIEVIDSTDRSLPQISHGTCHTRWMTGRGACK